MLKKQFTEDRIERGISLQLLKMLLHRKIINQPTYDKVVKIYKRKEAA